MVDFLILLSMIKQIDSIGCKSFRKHYHKKFAKLDFICGRTNGEYTLSYLVQNNKYLVVFKDIKYYNVYDMQQDKWLLHKNKAVLTNNSSTRSHGVIINDEILITYQRRLKQLNFYYIGKDYLLNPLLIHEYKLKTDTYLLDGSGMCVINFVKQESVYELKIMLFGGRVRDYFPLFILFNIKLISNCEKMSDNFNDKNIIIDENVVDQNKIKCTNIDKRIENRWIRFGIECISNFKNEPIIVIVGGTDQKTDIHLFNCQTLEFRRIQNVKYCILTHYCHGHNY